MANIFEGKKRLGTFAGTVLMQGKTGFGGYKKVFVHLTGPKTSPMYPLYGGIVVNPFKGEAKLFAGDLVEWSLGNSETGAICKILKTYEVAEKVNDSANKIVIKSGKCVNGEIFRHIPFVGDTIMVAPSDLNGKGTGVTVTAVKNVYDAKGKQTGWEITVSATLGTIEAGTVLVEATKVGEDAEMVVKNPNCYVEVDYDMPYDAAKDDNDFDGARYLLTPVLMTGREYVWINRISPLPDCIKALNESKIPEWFKL